MGAEESHLNQMRRYKVPIMFILRDAQDRLDLLGKINGSQLEVVATSQVPDYTVLSAMIAR